MRRPGLCLTGTFLVPKAGKPPIPFAKPRTPSMALGQTRHSRGLNLEGEYVDMSPGLRVAQIVQGSRI